MDSALQEQGSRPLTLVDHLTGRIFPREIAPPSLTANCEAQTFRIMLTVDFHLQS